MDAIEALWTRWQDAFEGGNLAELGPLYAEDARYYTADGGVNEGRAAIVRARQAERDMVDAWMPGLRFRSRITSTESRFFGDTGYDIGHYVVTTEGGDPVTHGHYIAVLERRGPALVIRHHVATNASAGGSTSA